MKLLFQLFFLLTTLSLSAQLDTSALNDLGRQAAMALNQKDGSFDYLFHRPSFINRIIVGNPKREDIKRLNQDMRIQFSRFNISTVLEEAGVDSKYKYIGMKPDSSLVMRLWARDGGFNYLFLVPELVNDKWKIVDIYIILSAQYISSNLKSAIYMPAVIKLLQDESNRNRAKESNYEIYLEAAALFADKEYQLAYNKVTNIPLEERERNHIIFKINVSSYLENEDKYYQSINEYMERFPNDPTLQLILLDKYINEGDYLKVYQTLDLLEKNVLEDNFLNYYRAMMGIIEGKFKLAEKQLKETIKKENDVEEYYWMLVRVYDSNKKYKKALKELDYIMKTFGYSKKNMVELLDLDYYNMQYKKVYKDWKNKP